jgi:DNA-3-methyladenine glycosylase II
MQTEILEHFKQVDAVLYKAATHIQLPKLDKSQDYFKDLCDAIVSQQLSGKAAATIFGRFEALFAKTGITPEAVSKLSIETMRSVGLSNAKASYIKDLAEHVIHGQLKIKELDKLSDTEIKSELVAVKGIGPWTAEMFLIFALGRPDVFSPGDLGLKKGMQKLYKLSAMPTEKEALKLSEKWAPYRSFASRYLWKLLDTKTS